MTTPALMIKLTKQQLDNLFLDAEGDIDYLYFLFTHRFLSEIAHTDTKAD